MYQFQAVEDLEKRFMTSLSYSMKRKIIDNRYFLKNICNDMRTHIKSFYSAIFRGYFIDENCFEYPTDQASKLAGFFSSLHPPQFKLKVSRFSKVSAGVQNHSLCHLFKAALNKNALPFLVHVLFYKTFHQTPPRFI